MYSPEIPPLAQLQADAAGAAAIATAATTAATTATASETSGAAIASAATPVAGAAAARPATPAAPATPATPAIAGNNEAPPTAGVAFQPYALAGLSLTDFACKNPACGGGSRLAHEPGVLSCGHLVCHATCRPEDLGPCSTLRLGAGSAGGAGAGGAGPGWQGGWAEADGGRQQQQGCGGSQPGGNQPVCPACLLPVLPGAGKCAKLDDAIHTLFPAEREARRQQAAHEAAAAAAEKAAATAAARERQEEATAEAAEAAAIAVASAASASAGADSPGSFGGGSFGGGGSGGGDSGNGRPRPSSKIPGLDERLAACTTRAAAWRMAWREMAAHADTAYTWFAVGCDCCGVFPIQGRRWVGVRSTCALSAMGNAMGDIPSLRTDSHSVLHDAGGWVLRGAGGWVFRAAVTNQEGLLRTMGNIRHRAQTTSVGACPGAQVVGGSGPFAVAATGTAKHGACSSSASNHVRDADGRMPRPRP